VIEVLVQELLAMALALRPPRNKNCGEARAYIVGCLGNVGESSGSRHFEILREKCKLQASRLLFALEEETGSWGGKVWEQKSLRDTGGSTGKGSHGTARLCDWSSMSAPVEAADSRDGGNFRSSTIVVSILTCPHSNECR
jgi:hypothetical protein